MIVVWTQSLCRTGGCLKSFDEYSQAFVIRFWLEPREIEDAPPVLRGMIEHVASGNRHYVQNLGEVEVFIASYLPDETIFKASHRRLNGWGNP